MRSSLAMLLAIFATGLASAEEVPIQGRTMVGSNTMGFSSPEVAAVAPALGDYTERVLAGDLWRSTDLSLRDRSIVTVAALIAGGHTASMPAELGRALDCGVKPAELSEIITHLAFYAGWPSAMSAASVAKSVFAERGIGADQLAGPPGLLEVDEAAEKERAAYVGRNLDGVAPGLRDYTNHVLFDEVWRRPGLTPRDRSLVTISALVAGGKAAQLVGHLNKGLDNGLTKADISAVITHLAFYAGWPNAMSAASVAKAVFEKRPG